MSRTSIGSGADLDASWHRFRLLRNRDGQHAILSACVDLLAVYGIWQYEAPMKMSKATLDATTLEILTILGHDLFASITGQGQYSSIERQFHFGRIDAWQINIQFEAVREFMDIHGRYPSSSRITVLMAPLLLSYLTIVSISLRSPHPTP